MTIDDINKLAFLARLGIPDEEKEAFLTQFESILGYVGQIQSAEVSQDIQPHYVVKNALRADENPHPTGEYTNVILDAAPDREDNYFKVPKVL